MRRIGWCLLLLAGAVAGACQGAKAVPDGSTASGGSGGSSGSPGKGGSAESFGSGGQPLLGFGASLSVAGIGAQSAGGRAAVDLSTVVAPLVRCHGADGTGGQAGNGDPASGGEASGGAPEGGAHWDDDCAPPPSQCADNLTLVYFDQGECVAQRCTWQKVSLTCRNLCQGTGCQDSITTK